MRIRWIWAANVTSVAGMTEDKLNEIPANITHSPYAPPPLAQKVNPSSS